MQATSPLLGLRGAASELAWRLGPVSRLRFHRPVGFLLHRRRWRYLHANQALFVRPLQFTLTRPSGDPCRASLARRWIALQSIRRNPCGRQTAKPPYSCLKFKNQNHIRLALACHPQSSSPPGFCGNATPLTRWKGQVFACAYDDDLDIEWQGFR